MTDEVKPVLPMARVLRTLDLGEMLPTDRRGRTLLGRRRPLAALNEIKWDLAFGIVGGPVAGAAAAALGAPDTVASGVMLAVLYLVFWTRKRMTRQLVEVQRELAAGNIPEAERLLARVRRSWRPSQRGHRALLAGYIADARGDLHGAIKSYGEALRLVTALSTRSTVEAMLVGALARGRFIARARALRGKIEVPPDADVLQMIVLTADLWLVHCAATAAEVDEDLLHAWVRMALEHNHTRNELVLLARILDAKGDARLSQRCLAESTNRWSWVELERLDPALHEWASVGTRVHGRSPTAQDEGDQRDRDRQAEAADDVEHGR